jgi:hypothetical protein
MMRRAAAKLLTGPAAFLLSGLIDVGVVCGLLVRAAVRRARRP